MAHKRKKREKRTIKQKRIVEMARLTLRHLNRVSNHTYRFVPNVESFIVARLTEFDEPEAPLKLTHIFRMISDRWNMWKGDDFMEQYYRPSTIFRICHFSEYVEDSCFFFRKKCEKQRKKWKAIRREQKKNEPMATKEDVDAIKKKIGAIL